jgi:hypothetical protein
MASNFFNNQSYRQANRLTFRLTFHLRSVSAEYKICEIAKKLEFSFPTTLFLPLFSLTGFFSVGVCLQSSFTI